MSWIAASGVGFFSVNGTTVDIFTAGTEPPFAINFRVGLAESVLALLTALVGVLSALYMKDTLFKQGYRAMAVLLVFVMSICGIIYTRDMFNLFVFIELMVISTGGLMLLSADKRALDAGLKYLIVSQLISMMLLLGIIFAYHATGSLNMDDMAEANLYILKGGALAFFLMFMPVVLELKPFPANGWGLDIYESSHPAFSALFSAATGAAALYAADKMLYMAGAHWLVIVTGIGIFTFVAANIFALAQTNDRRLLGYSSVGQLGLILAVVGQRDILGDSYYFIAGGILLAHALAKAGLYWISGLVEKRELTAWTVLRGHPMLIFGFVTFIALLTGLPPFPGFYAKWELAHILATEGRLWLLALILLGALLEATYLFRWFGYTMKREHDGTVLPWQPHKRLVIFSAILFAWWLAYKWGALSGMTNMLHAIPLLFALLFLFLEGLPVKIKNSLAIAGMVLWFILSFPQYDPLQMIFAIIILIGGPLILLASYYHQGRRIGFYPSTMLMFAGLAMLITAEDSFTFFAAWEFLTIGSYFLILRGERSEPHALSYLVFSLGGAFLILAGFALAAQGNLQLPLNALGSVAENVAPWVFVLLAIGFMTKTAAIGVHIWLPGAHAEAETDVSPMVSGILLKAGLFGFFMLLMNMGKQQLYGVELTHVMLWIGALSALIGNLMAAFQEDAKRLLAYSSIGQMGYALFGLAMMNQLGWLMALMFVINLVYRWRCQTYRHARHVSHGWTDYLDATVFCRRADWHYRRLWRAAAVWLRWALDFLQCHHDRRIPLTADYYFPCRADCVSIFVPSDSHNFPRPVERRTPQTERSAVLVHSAADDLRRLFNGFRLSTGLGAASCRCVFTAVFQRARLDVGQRPHDYQRLRLLESNPNYDHRRHHFRLAVCLAGVCQPQGAESQTVQYRLCGGASVSPGNHAFCLELLRPLPQGDGFSHPALGNAILGRRERLSPCDGGHAAALVQR